jgi:hypothetical protein
LQKEKIMAAKKKDTRSATPAQKKAMAGRRTDTSGASGMGETSTGRYEKTVRGAIEATGKKLPKTSQRRPVLSDYGTVPVGMTKGMTAAQKRGLQRVVQAAGREYVSNLRLTQKKKK